MTTWKPMDVQYVRDETGERPEPPFNPGWHRMGVLRWTAGCIKARTGVVVEFNDQTAASGPGYDWRYPELIGVIVKSSSGASSTSVLDSDIDIFLRGVSTGAEMATATTT